MPYSGASDESLPDNVKKMSLGKRKQWVEVFNSSIAAGDDEGTAFAKANGVAKKKALIEDWYDLDSRQLSMVDAEYSHYGASSEGGCASCRWFVSPNSCLLVWGDVSPTGKCKLWYDGASMMAEPEMMEKEAHPLRKLLQSIAKALHLNEDGSEPDPSPLSEVAAPEPASAEQPPVRPIMFVKTSDGRTRFFTSFTNAFKDLHGEIITQAAHKDYVFWATQKQQYPELQLWHCGPQSKFGQVDWLDYTDGFVVASGLIDADKEYIADALKEADVKVSHGFYGVSNDAKEIVAYRTFEVSVLPADNAANPYTSFNIAKEFDMGFNPVKREWLKTVANMSDDAIAAWESKLVDMKKSLEQLGIEYKEVAEDSIGAEIASYASAVASVAEAVLALKQATEKQATDIEAVKAELSKTISEQVESTILAKIAKAPQATPPSQSEANVTTKEAVKDTHSWFADFVTK